MADWQEYEQEAVAATASAPGVPELEEVRVAYLGRKAPLALALREVRDRETGMLLNGIRTRLEEAVAGARARARAPGARPPPPRGGDRRHAPRRGATARPPAPDHAGAARRRGRLPRARLGGARRPGGRDRRVQLRQARVRADALGPLAARHVLLRRRPRPPHGDEPVADPRDGGEGAADLHGLDRPCLPARRDHGHALPDLPPVRGARRRPRAHPRRPEGDAASRDAGALRPRAARPLPHALLPLHRAVDRARRLVRDLRRRPAAAPASSRAGSRWAAPAWSTRGSSRTSASIPQEWSGFAFGCGLERTAQLRHDIPDIRALWEGDLRVLRQFEGASSDARPGLLAPRLRRDRHAARRARVALSVTTAEVEDVETRGVVDEDGNLGLFKVGKVLEAEKHPNADRLQITKVDVGEAEPRSIVCGAWNFGVGATVGVALPGAGCRTASSSTAARCAARSPTG